MPGPHPCRRRVGEHLLDEMSDIRDCDPPGWHWEVISETRRLVRNPGPVVDPDLLWWRPRGPQSVGDGPMILVICTSTELVHITWLARSIPVVACVCPMKVWGTICITCHDYFCTFHDIYVDFELIFWIMNTENFFQVQVFSRWLGSMQRSCVGWSKHILLPHA